MLRLPIAIQAQLIAIAMNIAIVLISLHECARARSCACADRDALARMYILVDYNTYKRAHVFTARSRSK